MGKVLGIIEMSLILGLVWVIINLIHAIATGQEKTIENGFFWLSRKMKNEINPEKEKK